MNPKPERVINTYRLSNHTCDSYSIKCRFLGRNDSKDAAFIFNTCKCKKIIVKSVCSVRITI